MIVLRKDLRFQNEKLYVVDFHFDCSSSLMAVKDFASAFLTASLDACLSAPMYDSKVLYQMINHGSLDVLVHSSPPEYKPFTAYVSEVAVDYGLLVSTCHKLATSDCIKDVLINGVSIHDVGS